MRKLKLLLAVSIFSSFLLFTIPTSSWSYPLQVDDIISLSNGPGTTNGGEFKVNILSPTKSSDIFRTFCLEANEYFSWEQPLTIKGINDYATAGGISGGEDQNKDYLDDKTRYLYYHFYMGDLVGYDFSGTTGRAESADKLQKAIWMLEGEMTMNESNQFVALANSLVGDSWRTGLESVKVLNLYNADGSKSQDQLTMVPEPGTLLSLGIVLLGLGGVTRRKFKR